MKPKSGLRELPAPHSRDGRRALRRFLEAEVKCEHLAALRMAFIYALAMEAPLIALLSLLRSPVAAAGRLALVSVCGLLALGLLVVRFLERRWGRERERWVDSKEEP